MKKLFLYIIFFCAVIFVGCTAKEHLDFPEPFGASRLIAQGTVTDELGQPLAGIRVDIFDVRETDEADMLSYNYNFTDTAGHYTIVRYAGRKPLTEVTLTATDSTNIYQQQTLFAPVEYRFDSINRQNNAYVTADFVLLKQ